MKLEVGICSCHGKRRPIVNRKHFLCQEGNQARLNPNKKEEIKAKKKALIQRMVVKASNTTTKPKSLKKARIKQKSKKQIRIDGLLHQVYNIIDSEAIEKDAYYCQGCGNGGVPLSHSHTIPRSRRRDLITDIENIELECYGSNKSCHNIWENGTLEQKRKLFNFKKKMDYILKVDPEYYELINNSKSELYAQQIFKAKEAGSSEQAA